MVTPTGSPRFIATKHPSDDAIKSDDNQKDDSRLSGERITSINSRSLDEKAGQNSEEVSGTPRSLHLAKFLAPYSGAHQNQTKNDRTSPAAAATSHSNGSSRREILEGAPSDSNQDDDPNPELFLERVFTPHTKRQTRTNPNRAPSATAAPSHSNGSSRREILEETGIRSEDPHVRQITCTIPFPYEYRPPKSLYALNDN